MHHGVTDVNKICFYVYRRRYRHKAQVISTNIQYSKKYDNKKVNKIDIVPNLVSWKAGMTILVSM